ncbi:cupin domain-containing protein [Nocardioides sp. WL0053]|uniref:Cupin domain-containing protein n=1 Tax=Nocardioides jiangsuensis TaxID=2866161 RepID=A0ABS7RK42_9ACTN|nr:cupin domain-containing protein [Nocardioides jiangsuensis]MBY9074438.1 cupin domain-containing protein [Nocardioides jiangsuensis]
MSQPPGIATPLHRHHNEAEAFYLLDGEITYVAGEETYELSAGWFMYLPRGLRSASGGTDRPASSHSLSRAVS